MTDTHRRTLAAHLEGLRTWGIERVVKAPTVPVTQSAAAAPTEPTSGEKLNPEAALAACAEEVAACTRCRLAGTRTQTVFGVGDPRARLMIVGEAPGRDEDLKGEPFVGRAGQLLDKIIGAMGLARGDVYIANILKCRPPENRDPLGDEVASCTPYLQRQIEAIRPQAILALGKPSANFLLETTASLGSLRGQRHRYVDTPLYVTYHPAYLLRNPSAKGKTWEDVQKVMQELDLPMPGGLGR